MTNQPERGRGLGKCANDHVSSFGFPTRPTDPFPFCSQCGSAMVWHCPTCQAPVPDDANELTLARFCRECGAGYFGETPAPAQSAET